VYNSYSPGSPKGNPGYKALKTLRLKSGSVGVAAVLCLWGSVEFLASELTYQQTYRDQFDVSNQLARFEKVSATLPEDAVIGYLTDLDQGTSKANTMFRVAQYALAPRILQWGSGYGRVLGNFTRSIPFTAIDGQGGLRVERDFGDGVVLFRREAP
jgi:hypothetical protein